MSQSESSYQRAEAGGGGRPPTPLAKLQDLSNKSLQHWVAGKYAEKHGQDADYADRLAEAQRILTERKEQEELKLMDVSNLSEKQLYAVISQGREPKANNRHDAEFYRKRGEAAKEALILLQAAKAATGAKRDQRKEKKFGDVYQSLAEVNKQRAEFGEPQLFDAGEAVAVPAGEGEAAPFAEGEAAPVAVEAIAPAEPEEARVAVVGLPALAGEQPPLFSDGKMYTRGDLITDSGGEKDAYFAKSEDGTTVVWCQTKNTAEASIANAEKEFQLLWQLKHPNVLPVLAFGKVQIPPDSGNYYGVVISEYQENKTLEDYLTFVRTTMEMLKPGRIRQFMRDIIAAVKHIFANEIMHRDIKSSNILVSRTKRLLVADFGLSKRMTSRDFAEEPLGSPGYMAPDLVHGRYRTIADIWSIGALFSELLTGRRPFGDLLLSGMVEDLDRALEGIVLLIQMGVIPEAMLTLLDDDNDCFKGLIPIVRNCMAFHPMCRYDIDDLAQHPMLKQFKTIVVLDFDDGSDDGIVLTLRLLKQKTLVEFRFVPDFGDLEKYAEKLVSKKRDLILSADQKRDVCAALLCSLRTANRNAELFQLQRQPHFLQIASWRYGKLKDFRDKGIQCPGLAKNRAEGVWFTKDVDRLFIKPEFINFIIKFDHLEELYELHQKSKPVPPPKKKAKQDSAEEAAGKS